MSTDDASSSMEVVLAQRLQPTPRRVGDLLRRLQGAQRAARLPDQLPFRRGRHRARARLARAPRRLRRRGVERDGRILGFNFLSERDPIRAVGPIVVDPAAEGRGVGRRLMAAVLDRAAGAPGVRLTQEAFNLGSLALYAGLGFEAREPLVVLTGRPSHAPLPGWEVRPLQEEDLAACAALYERVHGHPARTSCAMRSPGRATETVGQLGLRQRMGRAGHCWRAWPDTRG